MQRLTIIAVIILCSVSLWAQAPQHKGKEAARDKAPAECMQDQGDMPMPPFFKDLSKEQIEQLKKQDIEFRKSVLPLHNKIGEAEARLRSEATKDTPDLVSLDKIIDDISTLKGSIQKAEMRHRQNIRKMLTEEQRLQFDTMPNVPREHPKGPVSNRPPHHDDMPKPQDKAK